MKNYKVTGTFEEMTALEKAIFIFGAPFSALIYGQVWDDFLEKYFESGSKSGGVEAWQEVHDEGDDVFSITHIDMFTFSDKTLGEYAAEILFPGVPLEYVLYPGGPVEKTLFPPELMEGEEPDPESEIDPEVTGEDGEVIYIIPDPIGEDRQTETQKAVLARVVEDHLAYTPQSYVSEVIIGEDVNIIKI